MRYNEITEGVHNIEPGDKITWWYNKFHPNYEGVVREVRGSTLIVYAPGSGQLYQLTKDDIRSHEKKGLSENDESDEELFGDTPTMSGAKRLIHTAGRKILYSLQQAWQDPSIQREYKEYQEAGDTDAMFDQVVRICKLPFKQVFVVDTVIREFAGMEGLNDFGWMIDQGEFNDLVDAWQRFRDDADIEHEEWFQRDARDFTGGLK